MMQLRRILVPTDFSVGSRAVLEYATSLVRASGAELLIVHVKEDAAVYTDHGLGGFPIGPDDETLWRMLREVRPSDSRVNCSHRLLSGAVGPEIVRCAETEAADLIVLGSHGRTGLTCLLLGSVAESVVRRAKCPVLTIRQPSAEESGAK